MRAASTRPGFSLQLEHGSGRLVLTDRAVGPLTVEVLALSLREVPGRLDLRVGADRFRHQRTRLERLAVAVDEEAVARAVVEAAEGTPFHDLEVRIAEGDVVVAGSVAGDLEGRRAPVPFLCRLRPVPAGLAGDRLLLVSAYETRIFGPCAFSAPALARQLLGLLGLGPWLRGPTLAALDPVDLLTLEVCAALGWKAPERAEARLETVACDAGRLALVAGRPSASGLGPRALTTASEGPFRERRFLEDYEACSLFAHLEARIAQGDVEGAVRGLRRQLELHAGHAFLVGRLLQLQAPLPEAAAEVRTLAATRLARLPDDVDALLALAAVRARDGAADEAAELYEQVAALARRREDSLEAAQADWAAAAARAVHHPRQAIAAYEQVLRSHHRVPGLLRALAALYGRVGDGAAALRIQQRLTALATEPGERRRHQLKLGEMAAAAGDAGIARQAFEAVLAEHPDLVEALDGLAAVAERAGEHLAAVQCLDRAARLLRGRGDAAGAAVRITRLGDLWASLPDGSSTAQLRYRQALLLEAQHGPALLGLATLAERDGDRPAARTRYEDLLRTAGPDSEVDRSEVHLRLGRLLAEPPLEEPGLAVAHLQKALEGSPEQLEAALTTLEALHRAAGRFDDVARVLEQAVERAEAPTVRSGRLLRLAQVHLEHLGDRRRVVALLQEAMALDGENPRIPEMLAMLHRQEGDHAALASVLAELVRRVDDPARLCALYLERGDLLRLQLNRATDAATAYALALGCQPTSREALAGLADVYRAQERSAELADVLARLARLERGRDAALIFLELGRLQAEVLQRPEAATTSLEAALAGLPDESEVLRRLGDLHFAAGAFEAALERYTRLLALYIEEGYDEPAAPFLRRLAATQAQLGQIEEALTSLEAAAREAPDEVATAEQAQDLLLKSGEVERIARFFTRQLERARRPAARGFLARRAGRILWRELRRPAEAGPLLDEALAVDPGDGDVQRIRLEVATALADWARVAALLETQIASASTARRPGLIVRLAQVLGGELARREEARDLLAGVLAERPGFEGAVELLRAWDAERRVSLPPADVERPVMVVPAVVAPTPAAPEAAAPEAAAPEALEPNSAAPAAAVPDAAVPDATVPERPTAVDPAAPERPVDGPMAEREEPAGPSGSAPVAAASRSPAEAVPPPSAPPAEAPSTPAVSVSTDHQSTFPADVSPAIDSEIRPPASAAPEHVPEDDLAPGPADAPPVADAPSQPPISAPSEAAEPPSMSEGEASEASAPDAATPRVAPSAPEGGPGAKGRALIPAPQAGAGPPTEPAAPPPVERVAGGIDEAELAAGLLAREAAVVAATQPAARARALLLLAEFRRDALHQPDEAIPVLEAVLDTDTPGGPAWTEALEALEDLLALRGHWDGLLGLYDRRFVAGLLVAADHAVLCAAVLRAAGRLEEALAQARLGLPDERAEALERELLLALGRSAEAVERLLTDLDRVSPEAAALRQEQAAGLLAHADPVRAVRLLEHAWTAAPTPERQAAWLEAARQSGQAEGLARALAAQASQVPAGPRAAAGRSRLLLEGARTVQTLPHGLVAARNLAQLSLAAWPANFDAVLVLDELLVALGDHAALIPLLQQQLEAAVPGPWRDELAARLAALTPAAEDPEEGATDPGRSATVAQPATGPQSEAAGPIDSTEVSAPPASLPAVGRAALGLEPPAADPAEDARAVEVLAAETPDTSTRSAMIFQASSAPSAVPAPEDDRAAVALASQAAQPAAPREGLAEGVLLARPPTPEPAAHDEASIGSGERFSGIYAQSADLSADDPADTPRPLSRPPADPDLARLWRVRDWARLGSALAEHAERASGPLRAECWARRGMVLAGRPDQASESELSFRAALNEPTAALDVVLAAVAGLARARPTGTLPDLLAHVERRLLGAATRTLRSGLLALRGTLRFERLRDPTGARADFQAAIAELPGAAWAAAGLGALDSEAGALRSGLAWLQVALHAGPDNAVPLMVEQEEGAFKRLARALAALGRTHELPAQAASILESNPGCLPALAVVDAALGAQGAFVELGERVDAALAALGAPPPDLLWRRAELLAGPLRRRREAAEAADAVLASLPGHRPARRLALALAGEREAWSEYVVHGEALLRLPPDEGAQADPDVLRLAVARVYADLLAQPAESLEHLKMLEARGTLPADAVGLYVHAARASGDAATVLAALRARVRLEAGASARFALAEHLATLGRPAEALAELRAVESKGLDLEGRQRLAVLIARMGG